MRPRLSLHAFAVASLLALGAVAAHAVEFTDPRGDDKGPGTYTYPTDGVYKAGSFDLVKLKAEKSGDNVDFSVDVAANLEDPWGMGGASRCRWSSSSSGPAPPARTPRPGPA